MVRNVFLSGASLIGLFLFFSKPCFSTDFLPLPRNQALAAHFALALWFGFVAQGHDTNDLLRALAADSSRHVVELSFTGCRGFTNDSLRQLLRHLPRQKGFDMLKVQVESERET